MKENFVYVLHCTVEHRDTFDKDFLSGERPQNFFCKEKPHRSRSALLRPMYRPGYDYAKAGVMLSDLVNEAAIQEDLFASPSPGQDDRAARLMSVMGEINRKSPVKVCSARQAGPAAYAMRREHLSPAYTTDWSQLPTVR